MKVKWTDLVLDTASLHLVGEDLGTGLLGLGLVNVLHEHTLVLEDVTLRLLVERVVALRSPDRLSIRLPKERSKLTGACRSFPLPGIS